MSKRKSVDGGAMANLADKAWPTRPSTASRIARSSALPAAGGADRRSVLPCGRHGSPVSVNVHVRVGNQAGSSTVVIAAQYYQNGTSRCLPRERPKRPKLKSGKWSIA
jgi:hypothetical protein